MTKDPQRHVAPRARTVADLPIEALLARADELARAWAIALIRGRPLDLIGDIPLAEMSRDGPTLCAETLRAMQSDPELDRLTGQGPPSGREDSARARGLRLATGAGDAEATVAAVEALRGVLWEALLEELHGPPVRLVVDVADRLAYVCARVLSAAISALEPRAEGTPDAGVLAGSAADLAAGDSGRERSMAIEAVIVDEQAGVRLPVIAGGPDARGAGSVPLPAAARPLAWDESPPVPPARSASPPAQSRPREWVEPPRSAPGANEEIEIHDQRGATGPAAWIGSIGRQLTRFQDDGLPFAVLLIELLELDSLRRGESRSELAQLAGRVEEALVGDACVRGSGSLTCEAPGRYWLLAPETGAAEVELLLERLSRAVASSVSHRQTPVELVIGTAICPDDGLQASALAAHADVGLYAARAGARAISGRPAASWPQG